MEPLNTRYTIKNWYNIKMKVQVKCEICNKEFSPRTKLTIICSRECRKSKNKITDSRWYKVNKSHKNIMTTKNKLLKKIEKIKDKKCRYCNSSIDISQMSNSTICQDEECEKQRKAEAQKNWALRNPDKCNAAGAKRRADKLQRTPKWLTEEQLKQIEKLYTDAKELEDITKVPYDVDHIVPLKGKTVSGLHVPWNLRVITKEENLKKHNKIV
jgi:hypothetical protein